MAVISVSAGNGVVNGRFDAEAHFVRGVPRFFAVAATYSWDVIHVPTGLAIAGGYGSREKARRAAVALWGVLRKHPDAVSALKGDDKKKIEAAIPKSVELEMGRAVNEALTRKD